MKKRIVRLAGKIKKAVKEKALYSFFFVKSAISVCRSGEGYIDTAVKILIAVVLGALLLAGLYALFNGTVLPTLNERIKNMFNYAGSLS
jgi:uncharacterized membrane protein